jgi:cobalt-zinc-cadmium efflux system protein
VANLYRFGEASSGPDLQNQQAVKKKVSIRLRLALALALSVAVFIVETIGGLFFHSSALVADALHIFTDIFAIGFSLVALTISSRPPTSTLTYGYHRLEVFASLANGISLFLIAGLIFYNAYLRIVSPGNLDVLGTIAIAALALAINGTSHTILKRNPNTSKTEVPYIVGEDMNIKSASTHIFGDALSSIAVIIGALGVYFTHAYIFDPIVAVFIGLVVLRSAAIVTWAGLSIMLEKSPVKNMIELESDLEKVNGVSDVHDLHIWRICSHITIATLHACLNDQGKSQRVQTMNEIEGKLVKSYGVQHATIQLEDVCCVPRHGHLG